MPLKLDADIAASTRVSARLPKCLNGLGPILNAVPAVSANDIDGFLVLLQRTCDDLTNMWTQCVHMIPIRIVPIPPNKSPPFLIALGIANIPVPREALSRCAREPPSL